MALGPWLRFFRLPNLPTAAGDALVGAAVLMTFDVWQVERALVAGAAALGFYLFGLADNDLVGAADDAVHAPERPLPSGAISRVAAHVARAICLLGAFAAGGLVGLPPGWWVSAALLVAAIVLYNRTKHSLLMGLCRGLSVLAGGFAVIRPKMPAGTTFADAPGFTTGICVLIGVAFGWTLYVTAITELSKGEEQASEGLGFSRWLLGLTAFVPLSALITIPFLMPPEVRDLLNPRMLLLSKLLLPLIGTLWTFASWCAAVAPLGEPHDSSVRRQAVGRTVGALLYLQIGFLLLIPSRAFLAVAVGCWLAARLIRRWAPSICGS